MLLMQDDEPQNNSINFLSFSPSLSDFFKVINESSIYEGFEAYIFMSHPLAYTTYSKGAKEI